MTIEIYTKALVLHEMPIGEYDKRLILLTKEFGKITAFAKGAKRSKSPLLAGSQIFSYGDFTLYKGSKTYNVNQISLIESFQRLKQSIDNLTYGLYVLEFSDFVFMENSPDHELMKLVLKTLQQLELTTVNLDLMIKVFELRALSLIGFTPWINDCVCCHKLDHGTYFSFKEGGILCEACHKNDISSILLSEGAKYAMEFIITQPLKNLFHFELESTVLYELNRIIERLVENNLNKKFKALEFLKIQIK